MSPEEFVQWMRGYFRAYSYVIDGRETFGPHATERIREALAEVETEPKNDEHSR